MLKKYLHPPSFKETKVKEQEIKNVVRNNELLSMSPQIGPKCNLRCIYCSTGNRKENENRLLFEEYCNILDQGKELGMKLIRISGEGEPLLDNKICTATKACTTLLY